MTSFWAHGFLLTTRVWKVTLLIVYWLLLMLANLLFADFWHSSLSICPRTGKFLSRQRNLTNLWGKGSKTCWSSIISSAGIFSLSLFSSGHICFVKDLFLVSTRKELVQKLWTLYYYEFQFNYNKICFGNNVHYYIGQLFYKDKCSQNITSWFSWQYLLLHYQNASSQYLSSAQVLVHLHTFLILDWNMF